MDILANIDSDDVPKISAFFDISSTHVNRINISKNLHFDMIQHQRVKIAGF